eukprot:7788345-Pyramimonas_sp.AAC.1
MRKSQAIAHYEIKPPSTHGYICAALKREKVVTEPLFEALGPSGPRSGERTESGGHHGGLCSLGAGPKGKEEEGGRGGGRVMRSEGGRWRSHWDLAQVPLPGAPVMHPAFTREAPHLGFPRSPRDASIGPQAAQGSFRKGTPRCPNTPTCSQDAHGGTREDSDLAWVAGWADRVSLHKCIYLPNLTRAPLPDLVTRPYPYPIPLLVVLLA